MVGDTRVGPNFDLLVMRIDTLGQTKAGWRITTNPYLFDLHPYGLARLTDSRVAVVGLGYANIHTHGFICILDSNGQGVTAQQLDLGDEAQYNAVKATPDSGLVVGGNGRTPGNADIIFFARYDKQLNMVWSYQLAMANGMSGFLNDMAVLPDGSVVLAGSLEPQAGLSRFFAAHVDALGNLLWAKSYSASNQRISHKSLQYGGGGHLYLSASFYDNALTEERMALLSIDTAGNFLWGNSVWNPNGRSAFNTNMIAGHGGTWILYGTRQGLGLTNEGMAAAFSSTGSLLWARTMVFEVSLLEHIENVAVHPNGGYLWLMDQSDKMRILMTDSLGLMSLPCGPFPLNAPATPVQLYATPITMSVSAGPTSTPLTISSTSAAISNWSDCTVLGTTGPEAPLGVQVLPQPLHHSARILLSGVKLTQNAQLHITDLSGRSLALPVTRLPDGWEIERGGLPAGIYAYQVLQDGRRIASGKLWMAD